MQAQTAKTDQNQALVTSQQSLQSIQTLLRAGLGCITYLRNLLPSDNFSESYLTSSNEGTLSTHSSHSGGSFTSDTFKRNVSGFKIMTVTRGFTEEADKLLDYLEHGVFDAVEKQYLRSCIFAIYLDNQDPNNIVEAYTFNFSYHNVPGTDVTIPIMSLDADLEKMSISGSSRQTSDPVADATRKGRVPTLGEVKRSLKALVKNLIQATTQMDALPRRRFATFKLFYYEHTPDDYEPMHFHPGDAKKDRWVFTTHAKGEVPERCSVGSVQTGYHGVDVKVTSVSGYLPSTEDNNAPFMGTTHSSTLTAPTLTPMEEAAIRLQQTEAQRKDAMVRCVAWDADDGMCDPDADSEVDPEYGGSDDHNKGISCAVNDSGVEFIEPMGIRDEEGQIRPFSQMDKQQRNICCAHGEAQYAGQQDNVPDRIAQLAHNKRHISDEIGRTQQLAHTQIVVSPVPPASPLSSISRTPSPTPQLRHRNLRTKQIRSPEFSLPPSDVTPPSLPTASSLNMEHSNGAIDTQRVQDLIVNACMNAEDSEMLDMNTQVIPSMNDSITSFTDERNATEEGTLECECGVVAQDCDCLMCDGGCNRWFHSWCMGFHSAKDERIPATFICFDCRVKADQNWDLIVVHDLYPRMIARFRDLAIFRRAIKVFETSSPDGLAPFTKKMGCDSTVAGQLFKRLEAEGFIATETKEVDALGLMETTTRDTRSKSKGKNAKTKQPRRKILQKPKYVFVKAAKTTQAYEDYFNPDPEVEKRVLRLSELKPRRKTHKKKIVVDPDVEMNMPGDLAHEPTHEPEDLTMDEAIAVEVPILPVESQTQEESQLLPIPGSEVSEHAVGTLKRKSTKASSQLITRTSKKIKISLGPAVDLGD